MQPYVGRYAPSPTGRLHDGNLRSAALAWADARAHGGRFLLRMEDLDAPRVVPGAADAALEDLEALGLDWDGEVLWQSRRTGAYQASLDTLAQRGLAFPCRCSRADIRRAASAPHGPEGPIYPGTCLGIPQATLEEGLPEGRSLAWRMDVGGAPPERVEDRRLGVWEEALAATVGAFVLQRADGLFAYQLACVVDDVASGISCVVRGEDLVSSCARQQLLWRALGAAPPRWLHLPLSVDPQGSKLSKRDRRWTGQPVDGPACLGRYAAELGWIPQPIPLSAQDFLQLYRACGWMDEAQP